MVYDLTDKLAFDEDPVLVVRDTELTVRSDAAVVMRLMDALRDDDGADAARQAEKLLFSEGDRKKLAGLGLKLDDYMTVVGAAVQLALGADPGEEPESPGE